MRYAGLTSAVFLLAACTSPAPPTCPDAASVVPAKLGGATYLGGLTERLAGPDRENVVLEAVQDMRKKDPALTPDEMIDILIAADCPNTDPTTSDANERARIKVFRDNVEQITNLP